MASRAVGESRAMPFPPWVSSLQLSNARGVDLLSIERNKSKFDTDRLTYVIYTEEEVEIQRRVLDVLQNDKAFDKSGNYFDSRPERYKTSLARGKRLWQLRQIHRWTDQEFKWAIELLGEPTAYSLHWKGFLPTIYEQGTAEQHELFLRRAEKMEIIGCYAQTELGHGSNVRKLETTATWDSSDRTFTLNSPNLTAAKWWIGTLGLTANYAIVVARLIFADKDYGPHPFLCQIRDLVTHAALDGVYVGDIGPKVGYNTVDNGFLLLNQVKIPHVNMLARFSRVDPERNVYVKPDSPALIYNTITMLRAVLVSESARTLARGLTIATRYCAVRCQSNDQDSATNQSSELQVLDYTMVQYRLFPLLAESLALNFMGQAMMSLYYETKTALRDSRSESGSQRAKELFSELHATSCSLKALATSAAVQGLEVCRRACGGHGYSSFAGIGSVYADYLPSQTYEGDNYVLTQQVASYLLKSARFILQGKPPLNVTTENLSRYLMQKGKRDNFDLDKDEDLVAVFGWRAAYLTFETLNRRDLGGKSKNSLLVDFWRLSTAHSQFLVVRGFYERLKALEMESVDQLDPQSLQVLYKLYRLHALTVLVSAAHEFYASSATQVAQVERADKETVMQLLVDIRPHAVKLVDAWKLPDWLLDSSLGRYDGRVYEDLFHRASQQNPLNQLATCARPDSESKIDIDRQNGPKCNL